MRASGTGEAGKQLRALTGDKNQDNCTCRAEQALDDEVHPKRVRQLGDREGGGRQTWYNTKMNVNKDPKM